MNKAKPDTNVGRYFTLIKSLDIAYITVLYVITAYILSLLVEKLIDRFFTNSFVNKTRTRLLFEITFQISVSAVASYFGRNIITSIPSPFHGVSGFDHYRVKELNSGGVLMAILLAFQRDLQAKIAQLRNML
jgi:hypothetical protein